MLPVFIPSPLQHLSISNGNIQVDASFMQTLWNVHPICSGSNIEEGRTKQTLNLLSLVFLCSFFDLIKSSILPPIGYLLGGHVIRLFHGHDEVVAIPGSDQSEEEQRWETQKTNKKHRLRRSVISHMPHLTELWLPGLCPSVH